MKIRTRLALLFTVITATILLIFASIIYISAKNDRENEFYKRLKVEALTEANLLFNAKVPASILQEIYANNRNKVGEVEIAIYNHQFELKYHDAVYLDFVKETPELIEEVYHKGERFFYQNGRQVSAVRFQSNGETLVVTATAEDNFGFQKLNNLFNSIVLVFVCSIAVIFFAGLFFARKVLHPIAEMTAKAKLISASNLDLRIESLNKKDELSELANTFNDMLNRLENSFEAQKEFVSNISHELRTPLTAISVELEMSLQKIQTVEEYERAIRDAQVDTKKIIRLTNSLLDFAKASYDRSEITFKPLRVDEVLVEAMQQVTQSNTDYHIDVQFDNVEDDESLISISGNNYLLKVAFANILENGCKFSENKMCLASIFHVENKVVITFRDNGIGISEVDLKQLFKPFFRGENQQFSSGHGIGLSLTHKIVLLHKGHIEIESQNGKGTKIIVELPIS